MNASHGASSHGSGNGSNINDMRPDDTMIENQRVRASGDRPGRPGAASPAASGGTGHFRGIDQAAAGRSAGGRGVVAAQPERAAGGFPEAAPPSPHRAGGTHTDPIFGKWGFGAVHSARSVKPEFGSGVRDLPASASFLSPKRVGGAEAAETGGGTGRLYVYRWGRMGRKGELCHVLARGTMNSCLVEFLDGYTAVTSRNAVKRATDAGART